METARNLHFCDVINLTAMTCLFMGLDFKTDAQQFMCDDTGTLSAHAIYVK